MKKVCIFGWSLAVASAAFLTVSLATAPYAYAAEWTCSAKDMRSGSYSGGSTARIHLKAYSKGGSYPVKKVNANKVTGKTKDGTPFTCVKK